MVDMAERVLVSCVVAFAVALTVSFILPIYSNEIKLRLNPQQNHFSVPAGRPFRVMCSGDAEGEGFLTYIDWLDPDLMVIPEGVPGVLRLNKSSVNLTFVAPSVKDSGLYTCKGIFNKEYLEVQTYIDFLGAEPRFESGFEELTVKEGSYFEMVCSAIGDPIPTYRWYDAGENEIVSGDFNSSISIINYTNGSTLVIRKVTEDHAGIYTCTASNAHGLNSKLFKVSVESKGNETGNVTGTIKKIDVIKVSESSVQFDIQTTGEVDVINVTYSETVDGKLLFKHLSSGGKSEFKDLVPGGVYTFKFSSGSNEISVQVVLLPSVPEVLFRSLERDTLQIEWFRTFNDIRRGSIDKYELSYYTMQMINNGNSWKSSGCPITIELPSCASNRHSITGLLPNNYYEISLRAHTSSGFGKSYRHKLKI